MGVVVKELRMVFVRKDNWQIVSHDRGKELEKEGKVERRRALGIILYRDAHGEFEYFYARHVAHSVQDKEDTVSVLVLDEINQISPVQARLALERALRDALLEEKRPMFVEIPQVIPSHKLAVRNWSFSQNAFIGPPQPCCFVFRDVKNINSHRKLEEVAQHISKAEFAQVLQLLEETRKPDAQNVIQYTWFIDKYFLAAPV